MTFDLDLAESVGGLIHLTVVVNEDEVWPHPGATDSGSDFEPEDILAWLTDAWASLHLEQSWPIPFTSQQEPRSITGLLRAAEERWEEFGDTEADRVAAESNRVEGFLYRHDLSQMKFGAGLGPCFVIRQQGQVRMEASGRLFEAIEFDEFVNRLGGLGNQAAELLRARNGDATPQVVTRWLDREWVDPVEAVALISGIPNEDWAEEPDLVAAVRRDFGSRTLRVIANDNSPLQAAARSSGALGIAGVAEVWRHIQSLPNGNPATLAEFRYRLRRDLRAVPTPLDQGIRAAGLMREWLTIPDDARVDLDAISSRLGIWVERRSIADTRLDGIATQGPRHGPAIVLNTQTRRQGAGGDDLERSLRFTWAHEIGHILLDSDEWPTMVDAARQRVPRSTETRANAFATYLLLPRGSARRAWEAAGTPCEWDGLERLLNAITQSFGLPRIAASRQLAREVPPERRRYVEPVFRQNIENFDGR
jgi:Zn-dependent peptidase ImmA (M78 family)